MRKLALRGFAVMAACLLSAGCHNYAIPKTITGDYSDTTLKIDINNTRLNFLWKKDKYGCLGFRSQVWECIQKEIIGLTTKEVTKRLGPPNDSYKREFLTLVYWTGGSYCNSNTRSKKKMKEYLGSAVKVQLKNNIVIGVYSDVY